MVQSDSPAASTICTLCLRSEPLLQSHIFPEFLYDEVYDSRLHSYCVISTEVGRKPERRRKGVYERLFCESCEQRLHENEDYAAKVFKGGPELEYHDLLDRLLVTGVDYRRFKLFLISLIWRASMSRRIEFPPFDLGPHASKMRLMLLNNEPGEPCQYGCVAFLPASYDVVRQCILPPERLPAHVHGHRCYRTLFGGIWWLYVVSSHSGSFPWRDLLLSKEGRLTLLKEAHYSTDYLVQLATDFAKNQPQSKA